MSTITAADARRINLAARFLPMDPADAMTLPCAEVAGIQVYTYAKDGAFRVSVDLDTVDEEMKSADDTVPLQISVNGFTVFAATADHPRQVGVSMGTDELEALRALLNYNEDAEQRDYNEQDEQGRENHIYAGMLKLRAVLRRVGVERTGS